MITEVIKRDGSVESFTPDKLNKWAEYAQQVGTNWSDIALRTFRKLTNPAKTEDIHQAMIDACVDKKDIAYSHMAARLEEAAIHKNMQYVFNVTDVRNLYDIIEAYEDFGVWDSAEIPTYNKRWQKWYDEMRRVRLEHWQWKQWADKYACKVQDIVIETPYLGYLGIALALFGDTPKAQKYAMALTKGQINLPTPALNGLRNGDWNTVSCCVISAKDTTDSIGIADYIAYSMTAKKAGIGIEYTTRSKKDPVKGGRVKHLGKHPIYRNLSTLVKVMTQITRGGNATNTVFCIDPEIEHILSWKGQKVDLETRIDKLDYSFAFNDAFLKAVIHDLDWYLISVIDAPDLLTGPCHFMHMSADDYLAYVDTLIAKGVKHKKVKALDLLKQHLQIREESGRFFDTNLSRSNVHTPFKGTIRQSNLCMEIQLPTEAYDSLLDLVMEHKNRTGETAFCSLSALNYFKIDVFTELEELAELTLEAIDIMIERAPMMSETMKNDILKRRSVGVGITGLASCLYRAGLDYDGSEESLNYVRLIAEYHYFYLLKASQKLAVRDKTFVQGIDVNWMPVDTAKGKSVSGLDWESLRGNPRKHSVLVAHMPTESSAMLSGASNGVYPVRSKVITKQSRKGFLQFICEDFVEGKNLQAWDVENITLSKYYSAIQDNSDQAISCDSYQVPDRHVGGKIPMSKLIKEFVAHYYVFGNKTRYYANTKDSNGGSLQQQQATAIYTPVLNLGADDVSPEDEEGCESCKL